jgi:hypothetical protein
MDYEHLEGKEVEVITDISINGVNLAFTGLVVGVEENMGVTIVDANDKDNFLVCLNVRNANPEDKEAFDLVFNKIVEQIEAGQIDYTDLKLASLDGSGKVPGRNPSQDSCVFS